MKKLRLSLLVTAIHFGFNLLAFGQQAKAQDYQTTPCDDSQYSAFVQLPDGKLKSYAKSGRKEDTGKASLYFRDLEKNDCKLIGGGNLTSDNYVSVGELDLENQSSTSFISIYLRYDNPNETIAGASVPQVIFTNSQELPCDIVVKCTVKFNEQDFTLSPKKISLENDNLRVGLLAPLSLEIKEVIYSVDGRPAYTKPNLEEFNLNYVPDGEHTITRTIVLKDGQSLTDSRVVSRGLEGGVTYLFISILYGQSKLLRYLAVLAIFLVIYFLILLLIKKIISKRRWKRQHFFDPKEHFDLSNAGARQHLSTDDSFSQIFIRHKLVLLNGLAILVLFFFVNAYVITTFKVDGVSMFPTLEDGSRKVLLTLPINIGKINNNYYLPSRGSVVVVNQGSNNLFELSNEDEKSYVVKRVVGLPYERVVIKDGKIRIFNKDNLKGFEPDLEYKWVQDLKGSEDIVMDITLKDGEVFIIGDNRDESIDSRFYGPISTSKVIGKVL